MRKLLFILFLLKVIPSTAQERGATVGTILRSLSGQDLLTRNVIEIEFKNSPGYTLLHFWESKSDSCTKDFPAVVTMAKAYQHKIVVYGFPYEYKQDIARSKELIVRYKLNWVQLLQYRQNNAQGANVIEVLDIDEFPTYMLLNKQGAIIVRSGSLSDIEVVLKRADDEL